MFKNQTIFYPKTTNPTPSYYPLLHSSNSPLPMLFHSTYALPTQTIPSSFPTSYPTLLHSITPFLSYPPELHPSNSPLSHPLPSLSPCYPPYSSPLKKTISTLQLSFIPSFHPTSTLFVGSHQTIYHQPQPYPKPNPILNLLLSPTFSIHPQ